MKNYNKKLSLLSLILILAIGTCAYCEEQEYIDFSQQSEMLPEYFSAKVKANKDTLSKAQTAIDNKDFSEAINCLTGYINSKSNRYEAYKLRGDAYYALRRYELAANDYQKAVDLKFDDDKFSTGTKYVSAVILGADKNEQLQNPELGNLYAALMYAKKAQNDPTYQQAYENAVKYNSHIYLPVENSSNINRINCPQKYYKPLNPTGIDEKINLAIKDIENNDFHSSIFKIQEVISAYPNYYLGYYLMGVALNGLEKEDEAIKSFEKSIVLNPYDFESYASLGQIYYDKSETNFQNEDRQKSDLYFKKALALNPNSSTYNFYLGLNSLNDGQIGNAINDFNNAIRINENDYNSKYYKLIAQYINGDYNSVISGAEKLIYKNVSNINSVHYLRALSYYKLGEKEKALADINTIENNVKDIFNSDIKTISSKDKILESYSNYLRSKIENTQGSAGLSADGLTNPIINKLDHANNALKPYEQIINSKNVSDEDLAKLENFYATSLPKIFENSSFITYDDIDTQYDFIRTTFSDLGVTFKKLSDDNYKFSVIDSYPKKRYSSVDKKSDQLSQIEVNFSENADIGRVENTSTEDINQSMQKILQPGESSLAQMLATNVLAKRAAENISTGAQIQKQIPQQVVKTNEITGTNFNPQLPDGEAAQAAPITTSQEPYYQTDNQLVDDNNLKKVKEFIEQEQNIQASQNITNQPINNIRATDIIGPDEPSLEQNKRTASQSGNKAIEIPSAQAQSIIDNQVQTIQADKKALNQTAKDARQGLENKTYTNSIYRGVSVSPKMPQIDDWSDVVELDLTPSHGDSGIFYNSTPSYTTNANQPEPTFENRNVKIDNNIDYSNIGETTETPIAITDPKSYEVNLNNVNTIHNVITDVTVPQIRMEDGTPQLRSASADFDKTINKVKKVKEQKTVSYEELAQNNTHTQDGYTLLDEYEKLLKIQKKQEKLKAKEDKKLHKEELKAQKLKAKEEQKLAKSEQKAKLAQEKVNKEIEKSKIKEEKFIARKESKQKEVTETKTNLITKVKNKFAKADKEQKQALKQAKSNAKAEAKAAKTKLKEKRLATKQQSKLAKQAAKAQEKAIKEEDNLKITKIKESQKTKTDIVEIKKQQEQLKKERQIAAAEKKAKKIKEKELKKLQKQQEKSEKTVNIRTKKDNKSSFLTKLKFWHKNSSKQEEGQPSLRL